jgi:hypothetical protein
MKLKNWRGYIKKNNIPSIILSQCVNLVELDFLCGNGNGSGDSIDQVALLPKLVTFRAFVSGNPSFKLNSNLTYLKLYVTQPVPSKTIIEILSLSKLKKLDFSMTPENEESFPYFATNNTITNLKLTFMSPEKFEPLLKWVVKNQTIRHLQISGYPGKDQSIFSFNHDMFSRLESFKSANKHFKVERLIREGVNLKTLICYVPYLKFQDDLDQVLLELPNLTHLTLDGLLNRTVSAFMNTKVKHLILYCLDENIIRPMFANENIETLILRGLRVELPVLLMLLKMPSLRNLDVSCRRIDIESSDFSDLSEALRQNITIESLWLKLKLNDYKVINEVTRHIPHFILNSTGYEEWDDHGEYN